jgi:hypothetical protein
MYRFSILISLILITVSCSKDKDNCQCDPLQTNKKLSKIVHNDNAYVDFFYDSLKRVSEVKIHYADTFSLEEYYYNDQNQIIRREFGDYTDVFTYYEDGLLRSSESFYENNVEWRPENVFSYDENYRIIKASVYFNEAPTGYIEYLYDDYGNTTERKEFDTTNYNEKFLVSHFKFTYDNKKNPVFLLNFFPVDLVQKNNPVYTYYYLAIMSSLPPEYESVFTYNEYGLPIEELRYYKNWSPETQP